MKALLQRVSHARVEIDGACVGDIQAGMLVLLGLDRADTAELADRMIDRLLAYRKFADELGRMNCSVADTGGGILLVSQFTLSAQTDRGLRPGFSSAMPPEAAEGLYDYMLSQLRQRHSPVAAGRFGADMQVTLCNDGPVTFLLQLPAD